MIMLRCTFYPGWCEYQEGQEPSENKAQHNPCLLDPWIIVAGLARFALTASAQTAFPELPRLETCLGDLPSNELFGLQGGFRMPDMHRENPGIGWLVYSSRNKSKVV